MSNTLTTVGLSPRVIFCAVVLIVIVSWIVVAPAVWYVHFRQAFRRWSLWLLRRGQHLEDHLNDQNPPVHDSVGTSSHSPNLIAEDSVAIPLQDVGPQASGFEGIQIE
ncbi:hypothetical protein SAMD00023353_0100340 [Rosellinia necatrix]|uniref:Uncharacterized protein n=1 Tax=Rosellinia necatrix TaxID=77044 RepID=A0A1S8A4K1_ROSNE|nr:hypothetical protein SAMD00023353_0100340 [Rosellinia necatrix]